jgi:hypothetical protein
MRTFTPAMQAAVGLFIVPYSRQHRTGGGQLADALSGLYI